MKLSLLSVTFIVLVSTVLKSQNNNDSTFSFTTDSVLISSSRYAIPLNEIPFTINIIDGKTIDNIANPTAIEELLNSQPGIFVNNRNNLAQGDRLIIRGIGTRAQFGIRGSKIFLDGIPLTFADGQAQLNNLNIQDLSNVEVLKGPSSVLYGNSLGGAILFNSKINNASVFSLRSGFTIGSFGLKKINFSSSYNFSENNNISIGTYYLESEGFRKHSDALFYGVNLITKFALSSNLSLNIISNYYNSPYLLNPSSLNKKEATERPESVRNSILLFSSAKKVEQFQNGLNVEYIFSKKTKINTVLYSAIRKLDNSLPGRIIDLNRNFGGIRTEFNHKLNIFGTEIHSLTGLDYEFQFDERVEFENGGIGDKSNIDPAEIFDELEYSEKLLDQDENVRSLGIFTHINIKPIDELRLFTGIRYDDFLFDAVDKYSIIGLDESSEISMNNLSYMIGFSYKLGNGITSFGNYSNGFQTPTTNELSNNPLGRGFNKELDPELVNNYELGIKGWIEEFNALTQISVFKMNFSNLLIGYQSETEEIFYRNAGKAENIGVEAMLEFFPFEHFRFYSSYAYMRFKYTDYLIGEMINGELTYLQLRGNYCPGVPQNTFSLFFEYSGINNLWSRININYSDNYYTNDFNGPVLTSKENSTNFINDAHTRIDLNTTYELNFINITLLFNFKVENIFDERYNGSIIPNAFGNNFFEPAAGRSYYLNLSIEF